MSRSAAWLAAAFAACIAAPAVHAEPAYSALSIIERFTQKPESNLARAICIGDCTTPVAKPRETAAFDLEVTFDLNSDTLTREAKQNLDEFAKALKDPRLNRFKFSVDGHTDGRGAEAYNMTLSERRAKAVEDYLVSRGVEARQLEAHGYGMSRPKTSDPLDGANRRVETRLAN